ncbi:hypothetical protein FRC01_003406 [Tulasnella sp. 417]|nr:hypothetical protein FRC01_003406 [Tulasnella sp. 417]
MSSEEDYVPFTGKNAEEAEDFVHAVNRRAWAAGKLDDHTWMAKFAYVCFTKKALRWYEELDEETRNDWRLLRRAILDKYSTPPQSPSIVPSSTPASESPVRPAPAAAPPTAKAVRRGRIRIDYQGNRNNAYISEKSSGTSETGCQSADNVSDACTFEIDTIRRTITFQDGISMLIVRALHEGRTLDHSKTEGSQDQ